MNQEPIKPTYTELLSMIEQLKAENLKLKQKVAFDQLTGLYTYNEFTNQLSQHLKVYSGMGLIMLDIDNFKYVNTKYGHLAGNRILEMLSQVLKHELPMAGFLSRFGGDEFLIAFPCKSDLMLKAYCMLLLQKIRLSRFSDDLSLNIEVSMGVALSVDGDNTKTLISRCDQALIQSKLGGKNQYLYIPADASLSNYLRKS